MRSRRRLALPALAYPYDALEPICSSELLELHHKEHHQAYVDGANKILDALADTDADGGREAIGRMQSDLVFNLSGHVLHSIFWKNLSPEGGRAIPDSMSLELCAAFGSSDEFRKRFRSTALSTQGSGWAALVWEPAQESLAIVQIHDHHQNLPAGAVPLLLLDMWEHAYYLQYRNEKEKWVDGFWDLVDWNDVDRRMLKAQGTELMLLHGAAA